MPQAEKIARPTEWGTPDRKSTRLNSSHLVISYAVFCLKKKQMRREDNADDHDSVWTSTETTEGRSRTMGSQLSPASADAYTCPPVVPKYTPHGSSQSTAIASRSTLT